MVPPNININFFPPPDGVITPGFGPRLPPPGPGSSPDQRPGWLVCQRVVVLGNRLFAAGAHLRNFA